MKKKAFVGFALCACLGMTACGGMGTDSSSSSIEEKTALKLEEVVDFVLDIEAGREVKILQLTDIQIIDAAQQRYDGRLHSWSIGWWATENMEKVT